MLNRKVDTDNDKYAMRCFLLCLGLVGMEHSASRKILLSRLAGNGAFRHPELEAMLKRTREVYLREILPGSVIAVFHMLVVRQAEAAAAYGGAEALRSDCLPAQPD